MIRNFKLRAGLILFFVFCLGLLVFWGCGGQGSGGSGGGSGNATLTIKNSSTYGGSSGSVEGRSLLRRPTVLELPSDLEFNVTFNNLAFYNDSSGAWQTVVSDSTTVNLLSTDCTSGGTTINISSLPAGTYTQVRMYVSAINLHSNSRDETVDLLALMTYFGENFNPKTMSVTPFTITAGSPNFTLYFYMPASNLTGGPELSSIQIVDGPVLTVMFDDPASYVSTADCATVNITVNEVASTTSNVFCGFFTSMSNEAVPVYGGPLTNNGNGTATGTFYLSPGTYIGGAFETTGGGENGPSAGEQMFMGSYTTFVAGQTYAYSMSNVEGGFETGVATGSATVLVKVVPDTDVSISLSESRSLFVGLFDSMGGEGASPQRVWVFEVSAGDFTSTAVTLTGVAPGSYYVGAAIDANGDGSVGSSDYAGVIGGFAHATLKTISDGSNDFTSDPVKLNAYSGH